MKWIKKGRIFNPKDNESGWIKNYAALPVAYLINDKKLRIYFSTRDNKGRSIPTFLDVCPENPKNIQYIHNKSILSLGELGTFDDNGIMPSSIIIINDKVFMYYIGWNPQQTVSYRLSIGLAISEDGGYSFRKYSKGPILDRDKDEPFFNTAPYVIKVKNEYWMYYVSCTKWEIVDNWPEPHYNVKLARSKDGIHWERTGITCIDYDSFTQAIGKPCVIEKNGIFKMYYSFRNAQKYRTDPNKSYRLGYAESKDGLKWNRKDDVLDLFEQKSNWDNIMNEYCTIYSIKGKDYLIYNGNGFGDTGFGYAIQ